MPYNLTTGQYAYWGDVPGIDAVAVTHEFTVPYTKGKGGTYTDSNGDKWQTDITTDWSGGTRNTLNVAFKARTLANLSQKTRGNPQNTVGEVSKTVPGANDSRISDAQGDDAADVALSTNPHDPDNFVSTDAKPEQLNPAGLNRGDDHHGGQDGGGGGSVAVDSGADGQQVTNADMGEQAIRAGTNVANTLVFDAYSGSGQLDNLNGSEPTYVVYPESCGTDPECTQAIFFEFYYKKSPTVATVTEFIETALGGAVSAFESVTKLGGNFMDILKPQGGSSGGSDASVSIVDTISNKTSEILGMLNEHMEGPKKEVSQSELTKDTRLSVANEKSLDKLTLYMPQGLAINQATSYQDFNMGTLRNLMSGTGTLIPGIAKAAAGFVDDAASSLAGLELNVGAGINALTGTIKNPRKEMMFSGTEIRSFDFVFNFKPKSRKEAIAMVQAIKLLRFHSLPEINPSMSFLSVPSEVQLTFLDYYRGGQGEGEWMVQNSVLPKLGRCAITSVNVTYQPEDNTIYEGGIPSMADVTITLTELEAIARNHVSELGM